MASTLNNLHLAIVGCGDIAEFHAPAFREAGFELSAVCSKYGSNRLQPFASRHEIPLAFDKLEDLLNARKTWDGLLIAVPADVTLDILNLCIASDAPILVEKPVAMRSRDLLPLIHRELPIIVGYNRRFYPTVWEARRMVLSAGPLLAHLEIPDLISTPRETVDDPDYLNLFFTNSVHGLDLARYVFGDLIVEHVQHVTNPSGTILGLAGMMRNDAGSVVQFTANWGAPANFSLTLDRPGYRLDLRPFEVATIYQGMEVREPTPNSPLRTYAPKRVGGIDLEEVDHKFKPGFVEQAKAFAAMIRGEDPGPAARLEDACAALQLAERLINFPQRQT